MSCRLALASFALALAMSCGGAGGDPPVPASPRRVSGTVTGVEAPVLVTLACPDVSVDYQRTTTTDSSGNYAFEKIPVAVCTVTPTLSGYQFEPSSTQLPAKAASSSGVDFAGTIAVPVLEVWGQDMGAYWENVNVSHLGFLVTDATVIANGQLIPYNLTTKAYSGCLSSPLAAGEVLSLVVTSNGATVSGSGTVPETPLLTLPVDGTRIPSDEYVVLTWTSVTSPDHFAVWASWPCGATCNTGTSFEVPGSARSATISTSALPLGDIELEVFAYNDGELTGDYEPFAPNPGMNIRAESNAVTISR